MPNSDFVRFCAVRGGHFGDTAASLFCSFVSSCLAQKPSLLVPQKCLSLSKKHMRMKILVMGVQMEVAAVCVEKCASIWLRCFGLPLNFARSPWYILRMHLAYRK